MQSIFEEARIPFSRDLGLSGNEHTLGLLYQEERLDLNLAGMR